MTTERYDSLPLSEPATPLPDRRKNPDVERPLGWTPPMAHKAIVKVYDPPYKLESRRLRFRYELEEIAWFCELVMLPAHNLSEWWRDGRRLRKP